MCSKAHNEIKQPKNRIADALFKERYATRDLSDSDLVWMLHFSQIHFMTCSFIWKGDFPHPTIVPSTLPYKFKP